MKWLSHPHHDDIRKFQSFFFQHSRKIKNLGNDLPRREIAYKTHLTSRTKSTVHRTANLCWNTDRISFVVPHEDGFDHPIVLKSEKDFVCLLIRWFQIFDYSQRLKTKCFWQPLPQFFGYIAEIFRWGGKLFIYHLPDLFAAICRLTEFDDTFC